MLLTCIFVSRGVDLDIVDEKEELKNDNDDENQEKIDTNKRSAVKQDSSDCFATI